MSVKFIVLELNALTNKESGSNLNEISEENCVCIKGVLHHVLAVW